MPVSVAEVLVFVRRIRLRQIVFAVSVARIGTTSFVLAMEYRALGAEQPVATAETTYVFVTDPEVVKCAIPDDLRRRLTDGAPGVVIDHAGAGLASTTR